MFPKSGVGISPDLNQQNQSSPKSHSAPLAQEITKRHTKGQSSASLSLAYSGKISSDVLVRALVDRQKRNETSLDDILLNQSKGADGKTVFEALAHHWKLRPITAQDIRLTPDLMQKLSPEFCLKHNVLPIRDLGDATLVAVVRPRTIPQLRKVLEKRLGNVVFGLIEQDFLTQTIIDYHEKRFVKKAEKRVSALESCRELVNRRSKLMLWLIAGALCFSILRYPITVLWVCTIWAIAALALSNSLKIIASVTSSLNSKVPAQKTDLEQGNIVQISPSKLDEKHLPVVSIIVPLYRESNIAPRLIRRLSKLQYPSELLDIILVVEAEDVQTYRALKNTYLPSWMRILKVPKGQVKTKPRAMNVALYACRGTIIGVYDAEDAPEPDQILKVATHFHNAPPEVVCVQGVLDYYNPTTNWLSRCFTIEYATWFRLVMPGLEKLGIPMPLGGTTLFFRKDALERLGAWDAHNVTEDADLGIRLARHGFRTEMVASATYEEANCRFIPWIKQRSRWIKGYMITWVVHMRHPIKLWRQFGTWRFLGFQIVLLCSVSQLVFAPLLWSFWFMLWGAPHPIADSMAYETRLWLIALFLSTECLNIVVGMLALAKTPHNFSRWWILTMHFYFPLASLASYKAAWEAVKNPFYWDKTTHGEFDT